MALNIFILILSVIISFFGGAVVTYFIYKRHIRRKSLQKIQRSEKILSPQDLIDKAPVGIFISTIDGRYIYANTKLANFLGFETPEYLIKHIGNIDDLYVQPNLRKQIVEHLSKKGSNTFEKFTVQYYKKDKSTVWSNMYVRGYYDNKLQTEVLEGFEEDITEQVNIQGKLKLSEKLYRNLFENIGTSSIVLDPAGMIVLANTGFEKLMELDKKEIEHQRFITSFIHHEDRPNLNTYLRLIVGPEAMTGETEARFISVNGRMSHCSVHVAYIPETGNQLVTLNDITEFRNTQEKLYKSKEHYKAILKAIPDLMFLVDRNGNFLDSHLNPESCFPFNIPAYNGQNITSFYTENISKLLLQLIDVCLETNTMKIKEFELPSTNDQSNIFIETRFVPAGQEEALILVRDITERKQNEKDLRIFAHAIKSVTECINITDNNNIVLYVNKAFLDTYGFESEEEVIGKNINIIVSPNNPPEILNEIKQVRANGSWQGELINKKRNGEEFSVYLSSSPIRDEFSNTIAIVAVVIDLSQRIAQEKSIKELNEQLIKKNKELEQIIYITSHDLRSPLVNIDGFTSELNNLYSKLTSIISENNNNNPIVKKILENEIPASFKFIHASTKKMETLINGLLKLARLGREEIQIRRVNMNTLISEVLKNFEFQIHSQNIKIQCLELPMCNGDESLLNQAFSNIISNSIKYSHPDREPLIKITGKTNHKYIEYCISDNGKGIPEDKKEKVFEIFYRLNQDANGEGLGLTIVKKIIEKHDGLIFLESDHTGTRFYIQLPIWQKTTIG